MRKIFTFLWLLCALSVAGQKKNESYVFHMRRSAGAIRVDGQMDDAGWNGAETASKFHMITPMDTSLATVATEVRMCYDDQNIYLLAVCHKKLSGPYMVESLRRDFSFSKNDNFLVFIDPFDDQMNGFAFGANAAGAQWDGTMYDGGRVDLNWDNKWSSVVRNTDKAWILEAAIPFKTIRYRRDLRRWGINFSRLDIRVAEKSGWAPVPRQFPSASLAYTGVLLWDEDPPQPGANLSLIPYLLAGSSRSHIPDQPANFRREIGLDAKFGISSSLNLDLTVNPDFSQVDVDRQVTNLDRFELFFPERRQFFLENGDQFSNFGFANLRPFFSRRIGLTSPILSGARMSGKLNRDWRMGAMDMVTGRDATKGLPVQNFAVLALQRRVFARSNIGILAIDRRNFSDPRDGVPSASTPAAFNHNLGLEYNHASSNNLWTGKAFLLKSFAPGSSGNDWVHASALQYSDKYQTLTFQHEYVGRDYTAEVGYVPRRDYIKLSPMAAKNFFSRKGPVLVHSIRLASTLFYTPSWHNTDNETYLAYTIGMRSQATCTTYFSYDFVELRRPFDPTNSGKDTLARGTRHRWNAFGLEYASRPQRLLTYGFSLRSGGYYAQGNRLNLTTSIGYRFQPYLSIALNASYDDIRLPKPWNRTTFLLVGPRIDLTLTNKLFITGFLQYNDQLRNMNINTRLQWRYRPASDLFIVYTDNYLTDPFLVRNRAIVLKFNYWWNM